MGNNIDICAVCGDELHRGWRFPEDFPDRFKFCCTCSRILTFILGRDLAFIRREDFVIHLSNCSICQRRFNMREKMLELITLKG